MQNKSVQTISILIIVVAVFLFGWYFGAMSQEPSAEVGKETVTDSLSILIDPGQGDITTIDDVILQSGDSVADMLLGMSERGDIELVTKDYGGDMGLFIEKINGVGNDGSDKWWQYWVNNKYAQVGVSSYEPKVGDVIMFKYTDQQLTTNN